jgi:SAM-dependent methyltransferase
MDAADFYTGIVPDVYAALRSTHFDTARYRALVEQNGSPVLELGCGDDGPFFDLASQGCDIEGVDSSIDMVRRGRERLRAHGLNAPLHHQRMEDLHLSRQFATIYLAGPTFNLLPDDASAQRALHAIAEHLRPDGTALVPLWTPPPTPPERLGAAQIARIGAGEARYVVEAEDYNTMLRTRRTRVCYELASETATIAEHREWIIHWHEADDFQRLAAAAGLSVSYAAIDAEQTEAVLKRTPR